MTGIFRHLPEATLLTMRTAAETALAAGSVTTSFSTPGLSGTSEIVLQPREALLEITFALQILNPEVYGRHLTVNRTRAVFH